MPDPAPSPYLVPYDGRFSVPDAPCRPPGDAPGRKECRRHLGDLKDHLRELQDVLYAHDKHAILCVFQAMDAAGKDSTLRAVTSGINPAGFQVFSFKQPSREELQHDFLWRTAKALPEKGRIGIFNRSYYEEVLIVRVHPEYLAAQRLPADVDLERLWEHRFASIREHEQHLARNGVVILKFWLNVSKDEQRRRFVRRMVRPDKNWKFSLADVAEREHWDAYMEAYEAALNATSRPWAPWYAIPADDKPYMRLTVASILARTLEQLDLSYPKLEGEALARLEEVRRELEVETD